VSVTTSFCYSEHRHGFIDPLQILDYLESSLSDYFFIHRFDITVLRRQQIGLVLSAKTTIDSRVALQPWRIRIAVDISTSQMLVSIATPFQLSTNGEMTTQTLGSLNTESTNEGLGYFLDRDLVYAPNRYNRPLSVFWSVTNHGFSFCVWEEGIVDQNEPRKSWFVVQRLVHESTGAVIASEFEPLFCVYGLNDPKNQLCRTFVVRESDINVPALAKTADRNYWNKFSVIVPTRRAQIYENRDYAVSFPNCLSTDRFVYDGVMDMLAYANTHLISAQNSVNLTICNESRLYYSTSSARADNSGTSLLFRAD